MKFVVFALLFACFGAVVALQNATAVTVRFALWSLETSLVLVILGAAMAGAFIVLLLAAPVQIRLRWLTDRANRRVSELEAKLKVWEDKQAAADKAEHSAAQPAELNQTAAVKDLNANGM
ncbi:MAG: LapA family protein [Sporomusaceae bacterium]|nr:LapA family protein [Sporomusaceae bacterium]